jgi:hypothetical protein
MDVVRKLDKYNDDWTSPPEVWENISQYLPKGSGDVIWEPFWNVDSKSAQHLRALGCNVVSGNIDFFTSPAIGTHIVSNPPFSCKEAVFKRLYELDMPFIVIIPAHSLCTRFIKTYFKNRLQVIIPDYRLHFEKRYAETGERKTLKRTPFDSVYVCYKMNLPRDLLWL